MIDDPEDTSPRIHGTNLTAEDIQVVRLRLQDATENLNDALRDAEEVLQGLGPASVTVPDYEKPTINPYRPKKVSGDVLAWDGERLLYNGQPLLSCSRAARCRAAPVLWDLCDELLRCK